MSTGRERTVWSFLFFLFWPLFSFLYSVFTLNSRTLVIAILLFYVLFGYLYVVPPGNFDSNRHARQFEETAERPFSDFFDIVLNLYGNIDFKPDFVQKFIEFTITRFTDNIQIYYAALTIVIALLLIKIIKLYPLSGIKRINFGLALSIWMIFLILTPNRISSFAHYTATAVYAYAAYQYLSRRELKYMLLLISSVFIHFGFLMLIPLFFLFLFIGHRVWVYYLLIAAAWIIQDQSIDLLRSAEDYAPAALKSPIRGYSHESSIMERRAIHEQGDFLVANYFIWAKYYFFLLLLYINHRLKFKDLFSKRLYSLTLLLFAFVILIQVMPAFYGRFVITYLMVSVMLTAYYYSKTDHKMNLVIKISFLLILIVFALVVVRQNLIYANSALITPFIPLTLLSDIGESIIDLIKN